MGSPRCLRCGQAMAEDEWDGDTHRHEADCYDATRAALQREQGLRVDAEWRLAVVGSAALTLLNTMVRCDACEDDDGASCDNDDDDGEPCRCHEARTDAEQALRDALASVDKAWRSKARAGGGGP